MYFFYSGADALDIPVPDTGAKSPYTLTIYPSERSQKTSNEAFYAYIQSPDFPHKELFQLTDSYEPPAKVTKGFPGPRGKEIAVPVEAADTLKGAE